MLSTPSVNRGGNDLSGKAPNIAIICTDRRLTSSQTEKLQLCRHSKDARKARESVPIAALV